MLDFRNYMWYNYKSVQKIIWRGGRAAEGAALEMLCTLIRTVGSNPIPSSITA